MLQLQVVVAVVKIGVQAVVPVVSYMQMDWQLQMVQLIQLL
jgi:hypothetical protein